MTTAKNYPLIRTIAQSNIVDKWIELWFKEEKGEQYHYSSKQYMFWNQIALAGLEDYVRDHGIVGLKVVIERDRSGFNEDITSIYA